MRFAAVLSLAVVTAGCPHAPQHMPPPETVSPVLRQLRSEAVSLAPLVQTPWVRDFLAATAALPSVPTRVVYVDEADDLAYTDHQAQELDADVLATLDRRELDEQYYYFTRYGTPLAYARPLDLLAEHGLDGIEGRRIFDFGYGGIGHLRLLASLGADAVGVEVDPVLDALYSTSTDTGTIEGVGAASGRIKLVHGSYPAEANVRAAVGGGFDVIISKNVLKRGYVHPAEPVDPEQLVHLGVSDEAFVAAFFEALVPGGLVMIYNLCPAPAPAGEPYIPWADGHSPFPRELLEAAGFEVLLFDQDDTETIRSFGRALDWDEGEEAMDLQNDLFAWFTILRKPATMDGSTP
jgi:hypothetical protein